MGRGSGMELLEGGGVLRGRAGVRLMSGMEFFPTGVGPFLG